MKKILRNLFINGVALWVTTQVLPAFNYQGGLKTLLIGSAIFMLINILVIPLVKILLLPLNLLTLGLFSWIANVVGLYVLTIFVPQFQILPYEFVGANIEGIILPQISLSILHVVILASFLVGLIANFLRWLVK